MQTQQKGATKNVTVIGSVKTTGNTIAVKQKSNKQLDRNVTALRQGKYTAALQWSTKLIPNSYSSTPESMSLEVSNGTGYQMANSDDAMEPGNEYYSADEGERQGRMEVASTSANTDQS